MKILLNPPTYQDIRGQYPTDHDNTRQDRTYQDINRTLPLKQRERVVQADLSKIGLISLTFSDNVRLNYINIGLYRISN